MLTKCSLLERLFNGKQLLLFFKGFGYPVYNHKEADSSSMHQMWLHDSCWRNNLLSYASGKLLYSNREILWSIAVLAMEPVCEQEYVNPYRGG